MEPETSVLQGKAELKPKKERQSSRQSKARSGGRKSESAAALQVRRSQEFDLRLAGATFAQIAERYSLTIQTVSDDIDWCFRQLLPPQNIDDLRRLQAERLERMFMAIYPRVIAGDLDAINSALKIQARFARLVGLDAPVKLSGPDGGALVVESVPLRVLAEIVEQALAGGVLPDVEAAASSVVDAE